MFDNPKKELEALEKQLLADEAWFEKELDSAKRMIGQAPQKSRQAAAPRAPQTAKSPVKTAPATEPAPSKKEKKSKKEQAQPKKKGIRGLLILLAVETLGILGLIVYWVLFLLK